MKAQSGHIYKSENISSFRQQIFFEKLLYTAGESILKCVQEINVGEKYNRKK